MPASKVNLIIMLFMGTAFAAQPPLPPKPPAIHKAAAILQGLQLPPSWKPKPPMLVMFESHSKENSKSIYEGVLETNEKGGRLKCKITYDSVTAAYHGEVINDRFSPAEWHSQGLDVAKAKEYYLDMFKQDPDQKKKMS